MPSTMENRRATHARAIPTGMLSQSKTSDAVCNHEPAWQHRKPALASVAVTATPITPHAIRCNHCGK
jgi:hypothetical protein